MPLLELKNLTYKLGSRILFSDLNLNLEKGEIIALTGKNGSGKSTLAELIMGLRTPSSGDILFEGKSIINDTITARARSGLSLAFQTPLSIRGLTVRDLLEPSTARTTSKNPDTAEKPAAPDTSENLDNPKKYLTLVGLPEDYLDREINDTLSGGEKKRIELASVLSRKPKLLVLDEPEAGIDLWSLDNLLTLFHDLRSSGKTLLIISHQEKILRLADRKYTIRNGNLCNL